MRLLLVSALICFSFVGLAQQFFSTNYSTESGLPSNQIYDVKQDKSGYIWIATDAGVSKFDGYTIQSFTQKDGLSDNAIVSLGVSADSSVWLLGFNKSFTVYRDSFFHFQHNKVLDNLLQKRLITSFFPASMDSLFIGLNTSCNDELSGLKLIRGKVSSIKGSTGNWVDPKMSIFNVTNCPKIDGPLPNQIRGISSDGLNTIISGNKELIIKTNSNTYTSVDLLSRTTSALLVDSKENIWVGTYQGLLCFPKGKTDRKPIVVESKLAISCITEDKNGSIWFGTFSSGLFQIPNSGIQYYSNISSDGNNDFRGLLAFNKRLFSFNRNNTFVELKTQNDAFVPINETKINDNISALYQSTDGIVKVLTENQFDVDPKIAPFKGIAIERSMEPKTYWVGGLYYFIKVVEGSEVFNSVQINFQERVNCLLEVGKDQLWLGTVNGLYEYKNETILHIDETEGQNITCLEKLNDTLFFGTQGNGLGVLRPNSISWLDKEYGLASDFINDLFIQENTLWIATKSGLNSWERNKITTYNRFRGLYFEDINALFADKNKLVLATSNGLVSIDSTNFHDTTEAITTSILLNGSSINSKADISFDYDQQEINIELIAFDFFQKEKLLFRYKLNTDSSWNVTQQRLIRYESLPPGSYSFKVQAQNASGSFGPISSFNMRIQPPFYQTTAFYLIAALLIGILFFVLLKWQVNKSKKRMQIENELSALKIKALSAQMNPHFIFNSLNSIQNFLIDSDLRKSNKYLTKFAKLMRLVLNNSDKTFVPIKDVLNSLDLYLELEKLRFNDRFSYTLTIDPKIEQETTHIPSMLIQPFVENAILHGILPREGKGNISLSLHYVSENALLCIIEDDGVGREFHAGKLGKKHKSQGLRITQERLMVFKQLFKSEFQFSFHDLKDEFDKPKGTRVELSLPSR